MVKVTLQVTQKELDAMEDLAVAWNLCATNTKQCVMQAKKTTFVLLKPAKNVPK